MVYNGIEAFMMCIRNADCGMCPKENLQALTPYTRRIRGEHHAKD